MVVELDHRQETLWYPEIRIVTISGTVEYPFVGKDSDGEVTRVKESNL